MDIISLIVSIVGTVLGIASLVITIFTWNNTRKITKMVNAEKIKPTYKINHNKYIDSIKLALLSLNEGDNNYYIITDLLSVSQNIRSFYDNWEKKDKEAIDKFVQQLDDVPENKNIDETTRIKLIKKLIEIESILERIGALNDIG